MKELFLSMGFNDHPFTKLSAEEEIDYISSIFYSPRYFSSLFSDIKSGASRFIEGERGSGKTALIYKLKEDLDKKNVFTVLLDQFDNIPLKKNREKLLYRVIEETVTNLAVSLLNSKHLMDKLGKGDKEKLAFFINHFFRSLSTVEFQTVNNRVTKYKTKNLLKTVYNWFLSKPVNSLISAGVDIVSDTISKSLGLNKIDSGNMYKNYIPEFKISNVEPGKIKESLDTNALKKILKELIQIIKKCGYTKVVLFFDKIDEYPALEGKVDKIVDFIKEIMQDNNILQISDASFVFSIWKKIRIELSSQNIRFDKFRPIDVTWEDNDLENLLNLRLKYFSTAKHQVTVNDLIPNKDKLQLIYFIGNKSPRDMLRLLAYIYDEQSIINENSNFFSEQSIDNGIMKFIKEYDFYFLYPKSGRVDDIYNIVNKILQVGKPSFLSTDYAARFKVIANTANSHIKIMKDYGLIEDEKQTISKTKKYIVTDPKLIYLIENQVSILR